MGAALDRVLRSPDLRASERQRRLLVYLVEETLARRSERLKAYNIATAVLGRSERFDPQIDPTVRIEISHLRRCLERYYLTDGRADDFKIVIPKGCYTPHLEPRPLGNKAPQASPQFGIARARRRLRKAACALAGVLLLLALSLFVVFPDSLSPNEPGFSPSLRIDGFVNGSGDPGLDPFANALTADLASTLGPFKSLDIYIPKAQTASAKSPVDYQLQGSVDKLRNEVKVSAHLRETKTGLLLWANEYSTFADAPASVVLDVARQVAETVGSPYGPLFALEAKATAITNRNMVAIRNCLLAFYTYVETESRFLHQNLRECHETAVRRVPYDSQAWAHLAFLYVDEYRFGFNAVIDAAPALDRATDAARHAIAADSTNAEAHLALAVAYWFEREFSSFFAEADRALALNLNDPMVLAEVGTRRFLLGDFDGGVALVRQALARNSGRPAKYHYLLALYAYLHHDYPRALDEARRGDLTKLPIAQVLVPAIYGKLGRRQDAAAEWASFSKQEPNFAAAPRTAMLDRHWAPEIADALIAGLNEAGLLNETDEGATTQSAHTELVKSPSPSLFPAATGRPRTRPGS